MIKGLVLFFLAIVQLPISFYLQFQILKRVEASELMWFFFWVTIPMSIAISLIADAIRRDK